MSPRFVDAHAFKLELREDQLLHSKPCPVCDAPHVIDDEAEDIVLAAALDAARRDEPAPAETAALARWMLTSPVRQYLGVCLLRPETDPDGNRLGFMLRLAAAGDGRRLRAVELFVRHLDENVPAAVGPSLVLAVERVRNAAALRAVRAQALTLAGLAAVRGIRPAEVLPRLEALTAHVRGLR